MAQRQRDMKLMVKNGREMSDQMKLVVERIK